MSARAAEGVCIAALLSPPLVTLAIPQEGRGLPVPGLRRLLEPGADLRRALRVLAVERAPLEDALDGLGHVQPAAAERRVERHDAVPAQPDHHLGALVAGEVDVLECESTPASVSAAVGRWNADALET